VSWRLIGSVCLCAVWLASGCPSERPPGYFEAPPVPRPSLTGAAQLDAAPSIVDAGPPPPADVAPARDEGGPVPPAAELGVGGAACDPAGVMPSFAALFERLSPSVVNIYTQEVIRERLIDPWTGRTARELLGTSLGSGLVLDREGYVLTNAHVVENAAEIRVRYHDDTEEPARLVGIDLVRDLALVKVDGAPDVEPAAPGDSDALRVGDWVIAIGNPLGLSHTLTKGIVSAKGRAELLSADQGYFDLIQTDAAINRGSSGGPLFDLQGQVVGLNTVVSAAGQGIAFAIPWSTIAEALPRLKLGGHVSRSWLGVFIRAPEGASSGVLVEGVVDDSPAARAGVRPGDVLLALGGRAIGSHVEFRLQVAASVAGQLLALRVRRGRETLDLTVRLAEARGP
jgi:serine protease Do